MGGKFLILGGTGSFHIALLHVAILILGTDAYVCFGGYWLLPLLQTGSPLPALRSLSITGIFLVWGIYEFSSASLLPKLPRPWTALVAICAI